MAVFLLFSLIGLVPAPFITKYSLFLFLCMLIKFGTVLWDKTHKTYMLSSIRGVIFLILGFGIAESVYDSYVVATAILPLFVLASILSAGTFTEFFAIITFVLTVFIKSSMIMKDPIIVHGDVVNGVSFYFLSLIIHYFYQKSRIYRFLILYNLENTKRELAISATFDQLSGALNRATFSRITHRIFAQNHDEIAVCLLDIDNFKQINDSFGHETGDYVIESVGENICASLDMPSFTTESYLDVIATQNIDYFGRLGGDEFFIIIRHDASRAHVIETIEYLQQCFYEVDLPNRHGISFSMGVVFVSPDEHDFHTVYTNADKVLYISKENGKDRYTIYGQT